MNRQHEQARRQQLQQWVEQTLGRRHGLPRARIKLTMVSGDASFRRYYRTVFQGTSYMAVDAPPQTEDSRTFVRVAALFAAAGVRVPQVHDTDFQRGFLLLEDFGDAMLLDELQRAQQTGDRQWADRLYRAAIDTLVQLQVDGDTAALPRYGSTQLHQEMALFQQWFCRQLLQLEPSVTERRLIADTCQLLAEAALAQATVLVHRDYHSRNLMLMTTGSAPGIIDFQDARRGPYTYDLVSLLRDCYIVWPQQQVDHWCSYYLGRAQAAGIARSVSPPQFVRDFDLMGLQRNLKVMGIFSRLFLRDGKSRYLADIPRVIAYFMETSSRYRELAPLRDWLQSRVLPRARQRLPVDPHR